MNWLATFWCRSAAICIVPPVTPANGPHEYPRRCQIWLDRADWEGGGGREVQRKIFHTPIWAASCIPIPSILFDENTIPRPTRRHRHTQPTQMQSRWTRRQPKAEQIISRRGTLCLYPHENTQVHSSSRVSVYSIIDSLCSYRLPALLTCILCGRIDGHLLTPSCLKSVQAITRRYV